MHYIIYKVTNQINGKFYIGAHKTKNLNDGYMGSGKYLKRAIEKYGVSSFTKEILFVFDNPEEMYAKEAEIVNEDFLAEENTYNLKVGGFGGFDYINSSTEFLTEARLAALKDNSHGILAWKLKYETDSQFKQRMNDAARKAGKMSQINNPNGTFNGKKHSEKTKSVMREKAKLRTGVKNSSFGSMWITNGIESKKIKKDELIPDGWRKGRKMLS